VAVRLFDNQVNPLLTLLLCPLTPVWLLAFVQATAAAYFKRFYIQRSCLEHDPSRIVPTCIYLAAKASRRKLARRADVACLNA
jgi:hypothetical protein